MSEGSDENLASRIDDSRICNKIKSLGQNIKNLILIENKIVKQYQTSQHIISKINIFGNYLKNKKKKKACVLGRTIEVKLLTLLANFIE